MQLQELNNYFSKVNIELLLCVAFLCLDNLFSTFDKQKLFQLAKYYPRDFSAIELMALDDHLKTYVIDMHSSTHFWS